MKMHGNLEPTLDQYMKATIAVHKMGDISRDEEDYCFVYAEDDDNYYGNWCEGYGFFDVRFPKKPLVD